MFKFIKDLGVSCVGWFCVAIPIGIGAEMGKDIYNKIKNKKTKKSNEDKETE